MIVVTGTWYDGKTSAKVAATCRVYDSGGICVEGIEDGKTLVSLPRFEDVKVSSRLADTRRYIYFPGGEKFETGENDAVDRLVATFRGPSRLNFLHRLHRIESRWRYVVFALAALLVFLFVGVTFGIPVISSAIAFRLPASVLRLAGQQTLRIMDQSLLHPSELDSDTQKRLLEHFQPILRNHTSYYPTVLFRKGDQVGPNAFALPNGMIVLTDEMVELSEQDDELVAVLAHELGHVVHRHGMRRLVQDSLLGFTLLALTGDVSGSSELFLGLPVMLTELAYSREFERQADQYALAYLRSHDIPPRHFAALMERIDAEMTKKWHTTGGKWPSYLSTHPMTEERIKEFE
jgi:Zn-dependent protease with chaperone function